MLLSAKALLSEAETNVRGPWVSRVGGWMYFKAGLALCVIKWNRWDPHGPTQPGIHRLSCNFITSTQTSFYGPGQDL